MSALLTNFKYFLDANDNLHAFAADGSQDEFIKPDLTPVDTADIQERLIPPFNLAQAQTNLKHEVNMIYMGLMRDLNFEYPQVERDTWPMQLTEANDLLTNGDSAVTPFIDALVEGREITRVEMANKIVEKDAAYRVIAGKITGIKQDHFKGIEALSLLPKKSAQAASENYDYSQGWPEVK